MPTPPPPQGIRQVGGWVSQIPLGANLTPPPHITKPWPDTHTHTHTQTHIHTHTEGVWVAVYSSETGTAFGATFGARHPNNMHFVLDVPLSGMEAEYKAELGKGYSYDSGAMSAPPRQPPHASASKLVRGDPCRGYGACIWGSGCGRDAWTVHSLVVVLRGRKGRDGRIIKTLLQCGQSCRCGVS